MDMLRIACLLMALTLTSACFNAGAGAAPPSRSAQPVVVELFESQGCSSCPPANANVNALADRPDVLTLIYGVTYWDQLGWKDTFARPEFTARQLAYARGLGNPNVYTPQVILNGREQIVGNDRVALDAAVRRAGRTPFAVVVSVADGAAEVRGPQNAAAGADIWLVRYDPRTLDVPILAGENNGRTLPHTHVVREVRLLGRWDGTSRRFALPTPTPSELRAIVLVQAPNGGPIIGAARA